MPLGVVVSKEDNAEDVLEEDGTDPPAAALWGA